MPSRTVPTAPSAQCGIIAAVEKCLKTTIGLDLAVSVASGQPFLNHFDVFDAGRVGFWCGESGRPTIKETLNRICTEKKLNLRDIGDQLRLGYSVPSLKKQIDIIQRFVEQEQPKLVIIDPLNFAMRDSAGDIANATAVAAVLSPLNEICQENGCSFIAIAHNKKPSTKEDRAPRYRVPELDEVAGAGIGAWTRFWMCLGKRRDFIKETGDHRLWMNVGGSAGHAATFGLDVHEGSRSDPGGRVWNVTLRSVEEAKALDKEAKYGRGQSPTGIAAADHETKIIQFLHDNPLGDTQTGIATAVKVSGGVAKATIERLLDKELVVPMQVRKGKKTETVYALTDPRVAA